MFAKMTNETVFTVQTDSVIYYGASRLGDDSELRVDTDTIAKYHRSQGDDSI